MGIVLYSNKPMNEKLRFYEQVLVLHPDTLEEDHKEICHLLSKIVEKEKGEVFRIDTWGSRQIANPKAKKATRGFYFHLLFSSSSGGVAEIRRQLSINRKVLYFHEEKLAKKETAKSHIEKFFNCLEQTAQKEKDRQAKIQKRQAHKA